MGYAQKELMRAGSRLLGLAILAASLAAGPADSPDALIIAEPTTELLVTAYPAMAALGAPPILLYTSGLEPYITEYLDQIAARKVWLIDPGQVVPDAWRRRFETLQVSSRAEQLEWLGHCWSDLSSVVLVNSSEPRLVLAATLLATARRVPAVYLHDELDDATRGWLRKLSDIQVVCVGQMPVGLGQFVGSQLVHLRTEAETMSAYHATLGETPPEHLVVLGPPSANSPSSSFAALVPEYAVKHRAAVVMVGSSKDHDIQLTELVRDRYPAIKYVTLWGGVDTLPDEQIDDPVAAAGLDTKLTETTVAVPPLTGLRWGQPCQFRVGRIAGENPASVSLLVARTLTRPKAAPGKAPTALILANLDYELPLMETITRSTAQTFEQCGWKVRSFYGWQAGWYRKPNRLWGADLVLYEGHTAYLARSVRFDHEREPVYPGLYVFQGCKTLRQPEVIALLRNGASGVVGTTTNTYSASGSALAKTYVDCMLLDGMDAGTSLMSARNFMLALANLKERRGHEQGPKLMRCGLTFSLWGDPSWTPPPSPRRPGEKERVSVLLEGNTAELIVPDDRLPAVEVTHPASGEHYVAQVPIGAKLAGMYEWEDEAHTRRQLPPLYFGVVSLPDFERAEGPQIRTPLAKNRWSSLWDQRNRLLYLVVQSSARNDFDRGKKLSFHIE